MNYGLGNSGICLSSLNTVAYFDFRISVEGSYSVAENCKIDLILFS